MSQKKINLMNLQKSYNTEKVAFINKQILKLKKRKNKTVWLHLAKLFYFYIYHGTGSLNFFLVLMLQDQYNLEVFFATVKDKVVFGFR